MQCAIWLGQQSKGREKRWGGLHRQNNNRVESMQEDLLSNITHKCSEVMYSCLFLHAIKGTQEPSVLHLSIFQLHWTFTLSTWEEENYNYIENAWDETPPSWNYTFLPQLSFSFPSKIDNLKLIQQKTFTAVKHLLPLEESEEPFLPVQCFSPKCQIWLNGSVSENCGVALFCWPPLYPAVSDGPVQ